MEHKQALALLAQKMKAGGVNELRRFSDEIEVPFATVYNWHRVKKIPHWRLETFAKAKVAPK